MDREIKLDTQNFPALKQLITDFKIDICKELDLAAEVAEQFEITIEEKSNNTDRKFLISFNFREENENTQRVFLAFKPLTIYYDTKFDFLPDLLISEPYLERINISNRALKVKELIKNFIDKIKEIIPADNQNRQELLKSHTFPKDSKRARFYDFYYRDCNPDTQHEAYKTFFNQTQITFNDRDIKNVTSTNVLYYKKLRYNRLLHEAVKEQLNELKAMISFAHMLDTQSIRSNLNKPLARILKATSWKKMHTAIASYSKDQKTHLGTLLDQLTYKVGQNNTIPTLREFVAQLSENENTQKLYQNAMQLLQGVASNKIRVYGFNAYRIPGVGRLPRHVEEIIEKTVNPSEALSNVNDTKTFYSQRVGTTSFFRRPGTQRAYDQLKQTGEYNVYTPRTPGKA